MELPHVSLDSAPPLPSSCPPEPHPTPAARIDALRVDGPADGRADAPGDARIDGGADGSADGRGDGPAAQEALSGAVVMYRPAGSDGGPGPAGGGLPPVMLGPRRSAAQRVLDMLSHWARRACQSALQTVTNPRGPYHAQPESLAAHDEYRRSRAWVPDGHEGRFLGPLGGFYHHTLGRAGMASGYLWAWLWARPLRIFLAAVVVGGIYLGFQFG